MAAETVVEISNVWKIFGARAEDALRAVRDKGLTKAQVLAEYNAVVGVADVSLSVNRGEIFCIMGLSGSGKSTLVRHFNRLLEPTAGKIEIEGTDVMALGPRELQRFRNQNIAVGVVIAILIPGAILKKDMAFKAQFRSKSSSLPSVIGLGGPLGHDHVSAFFQRLSHQEFKLAGLVSARRHAGAIVPFDPQLNTQFFRKPLHRLKRRGKMGKVNARKTGKMHCEAPFVSLRQFTSQQELFPMQI